MVWLLFLPYLLCLTLSEAHSRVFLFLLFFFLLFSEQLQELVAASGLTGDLVRHWFSRQAPLSRMEKAASAQVAAPRPVVPGEAVEPTATGSSSPLEPQAGRGTEEKMEQSVCGVAPGALKANTDRTVNPTKGI